MWNKHCKQYGAHDIVTGLGFCLSGRPWSALRPTLLAHRTHGMALSGRNCTVQSWGTYRRPYLRILRAVDQTRGAVVTFLTRLIRAGLVSVSAKEVEKVCTRSEILDAGVVEDLRFNGLSAVERGWM